MQGGNSSVPKVMRPQSRPPPQVRRPQVAGDGCAGTASAARPRMSALTLRVGVLLIKYIAAAVLYIARELAVIEHSLR